MQNILTVASLAAVLVGGNAVATAAQAAPNLSHDPNLQPAAIGVYLWGGHRYCWYGGGWKGAGWYWCGNPWRRGYGWGGGRGWNGWVGHGYGWDRGYHGGWRHGWRDRRWHESHWRGERARDGRWHDRHDGDHRRDGDDAKRH